MGIKSRSIVDFYDEHMRARERDIALAKLAITFLMITGESDTWHGRKSVSLQDLSALGDISFELQKRALFVTKEGHVGIFYHFDYIGVQANDILVCLFGIKVPFVLRLVSGTSSYEMINVAHVPGYGGNILGDRRAEDWG
jgi:hypothetical protein